MSKSHDGSVLSSFQFAIVMETVSQDIRHGCLLEHVYASHLLIADNSMKK